MGYFSYHSDGNVNFEVGYNMVFHRAGKRYYNIIYYILNIFAHISKKSIKFIRSIGIIILIALSICLFNGIIYFNLKSN